MTIWMEVSKDKYQLPVCLADSVGELAIKCGCSQNSIMSAMSHYKAGRAKSCRFVKVEIEENEE